MRTAIRRPDGYKQGRSTCSNTVDSAAGRKVAKYCEGEHPGESVGGARPSSFLDASQLAWLSLCPQKSRQLRAGAEMEAVFVVEAVAALRRQGNLMLVLASRGRSGHARQTHSTRELLQSSKPFSCAHSVSWEGVPFECLLLARPCLASGVALYASQTQRRRMRHSSGGIFGKMP